MRIFFKKTSMLPWRLLIIQKKTCFVQLFHKIIWSRWLTGSSFCKSINYTMWQTKKHKWWLIRQRKIQQNRAGNKVGVSTSHVQSVFCVFQQKKEALPSLTLESLDPGHHCPPLAQTGIPSLTHDTFPPWPRTVLLLSERDSPPTTTTTTLPS